jgi:carboxyl-terminal processing protease
MNSYPARRRGGRLRNAFLLLHTAQAFDFSSFGKKPTPKKKTFRESFETYKNKINLPADAGAFARGTLAGIALSVFVAVGPVGDSINTEGREAREAAAQFEIVLDALDKRYVDRVSPKKLMESAVEAMLATLDPYTEYAKSTQASDMIESVEGRYGGVGLVISGKPRGKDPVKAMKSGEVDVAVVDAYEDYAWEAGLRPRDTLLSIGGSTPSGSSGDAVLDAARSSLRGKPGTDVSVEYKHPWETTTRSTDLKRFAVRRRDVELVTLLPSPTAPKVVAYARVGGFSRETAPELVEGLASLRFDSQKSKLEGVIIDLRGNPGGLLDAAVDVASLFLPPDAVIASAGGRGFVRDATPSGETPKEKDGVERVEFRSRARGVTLFGVAPVVVLVDGQSASASEIVAGALQDYDAGVVVGSRTFGKGLIQDVSPLPFDGAALKVTVGRYYTPSGRCLQELDYEKERSLQSKKEVSPKESFYTVNSKRPIESGGGVAPDVVVEPDTLTKAETALLRSGVANKFADDWVDKRPDVAKTLYARGLEPDADAASLVLQRSDLDSLKQRALKAIADDPDSKDGREAKREVEDAFRRHPDRILKVTDALVKERFFRSSALLKAQVSDEKAVVASMKLLSDKARFDAILAPPTKSAASAPNAVAAAGLGNAARDASSS